MWLCNIRNCIKCTFHITDEINYDKVNKLRGMDIVIVTTAKTNEEAKALLVEIGMPFVKKGGH